MNSFTGKTAPKYHWVYMFCPPFFRNRTIMSTKLSIYKALIRPIVIYGAESWAITRTIGIRADILEHYILRRTSGAVKQGKQLENKIQ